MSIWQILTAIPELIKLIRDLLTLAREVFGDNPRKFIKDAGQVFAELKVADTPEKKLEAAKKIQLLVERL